MARAAGVGGFLRILRRRLGADSSADFWTEYLTWLTFAVPGGLAKGNAWCMDYAIRRLPEVAPDAAIVEIGSSCGLSANAMTYIKNRRGVANRLVTCDPWTFEGGPAVGEMLGDSPEVRSAAYREFMKENYVRNTRFFSAHDLPFTVEMTSDEFFVAWSNNEGATDVFGREAALGGAIGFCYIDGNHTYEFALRDFENCDRYLVPGGFVLFDDSADGSGWESRDVAFEVARSDRYELIAKNPNYFLRKLPT